MADEVKDKKKTSKDKMDKLYPTNKKKAPLSEANEDAPSSLEGRPNAAELSKEKKK